MHCPKTIYKLEEYLDGTLDTASGNEFREHLEICAECQRRFVRERELRAALKDMPVPVPDPDFEDRIFKRAMAVQHRRRIPSLAIMKMAAGILIVFALGFVFKGIWGPGRTLLPEAFVVLNKPEEVRLVFYSKENMRNVTISLEPPPGVEILGFENRREIVWQIDLKQGANLLELPVIARNRNGGSLIARIRHGNRTKTFGLLLKVQEPGFTGNGAGKFENHVSSQKSI